MGSKNVILNFVNNALSNKDKQLVFKTTRKFNVSDLDFIREELLDHIEKILNNNVDYSKIHNGVYFLTGIQTIDEDDYFDDELKNYKIQAYYTYYEKVDSNCKYLPTEECMSNYIERSLHIHKNYNQISDFLKKEDVLDDYTYNFEIIDEDDNRAYNSILEISLSNQNNLESIATIPMQAIIESKKESLKDKILDAFYEHCDDKEFEGLPDKAFDYYEYDDIYDEVHHYKFKVVDYEVNHNDEEITVYVNIID